MSVSVLSGGFVVRWSPPYRSQTKEHGHEIINEPQLENDLEAGVDESRTDYKQDDVRKFIEKRYV